MTRGSEKDRYGDKLRDAEKAREDKFFADRDKELLAKLRQEKAGEDEPTLRALAHMRCPRCGEHLVEKEVSGVTLDECPSCQGLWLDKGELDALGRNEKHGWLARYLGFSG
jgi:hypothetical protein